MTVVMYWKERLIAKQPFYCDSLRVRMATFRPNRRNDADSWPHALHRETMHSDYSVWHDEVYLKPYRESGYYAENPELMPQAVPELDFFTTISPFIYLVGRKEQVRTYLVPERKWHGGEWYDTKSNRYFVRLCFWEQHVAAFELMTGTPLHLEVSYFQPDQARVVQNAIIEYRKTIAEGRILFGTPSKSGTTV